MKIICCMVPVERQPLQLTYVLKKTNNFYIFRVIMILIPVAIYQTKFQSDYSQSFNITSHTQSTWQATLTTRHASGNVRNTSPRETVKTSQGCSRIAILQIHSTADHSAKRVNMGTEFKSIRHQHTSRQSA